MEWIVPDNWSKESLEKNVGSSDVQVSGASSVLAEALACEGPRLLVLRASSGKGLVLAKINPPQRQTGFAVVERVDDNEGPSYRAGGFLGLSDEPVYEDEAPSKKKKRFWQ